MSKRRYIIARGGFVFDGDTFQAITSDDKKITVRLYGVDAPEKTQFGAAFSKELLSKLVKNEKIQLCPIEQDKYGRSVCVVHRFRDDQDVSMVMLRKGMVRASVRSGLYALDYNVASAKAKAYKYGLWKGGALFSDPKEFRDNKNKIKFNSFKEADDYDKAEKERLENLYLGIKKDERLNRLKQNSESSSVKDNSKNDKTNSILDLVNRIRDRVFKDDDSHSKNKDVEEMGRGIRDRIRRNM